MKPMQWTQSFTLDDLERIGHGTAAQHCGVRFVAMGEDWLEATIPLDSRTMGSDGVLHPGALGILAETIGSVAASLCIDTSRRICVGQVLHVNHPVPVTNGPIRAKTTAVAVLADSHVWNIEMTDPTGATVCVARLTMAILDRPNQQGGRE
jgi:1,4-dihydroxy-2-naphthoyl-CoA hydrolase